MKVNINPLKILNTSIDDVISSIRRLRDYCTKENVVHKPFDELEFVELFYLVWTHKDKDKIPLGLVKYLNDYAVEWEEEIIDDVQEEGGYYNIAENSELVAKMLINLGNYFVNSISPNASYWGLLIVDLFEIYPKLDDVEVYERTPNGDWVLVN
ncbi:MAG: hypothetical protein ACK5N8_04145 [Alphaproteobacteria bacterium]